MHDISTEYLLGLGLSGRGLMLDGWRAFWRFARFFERRILIKPLFLIVDILLKVYYGFLLGNSSFFLLL